MSITAKILWKRYSKVVTATDFPSLNRNYFTSVDDIRLTAEPLTIKNCLDNQLDDGVHVFNNQQYFDENANDMEIESVNKKWTTLEVSHTQHGISEPYVGVKSEWDSFPQMTKYSKGLAWIGGGPSDPFVPDTSMYFPPNHTYIDPLTSATNFAPDILNHALAIVTMRIDFFMTTPTHGYAVAQYIWDEGPVTKNDQTHESKGVRIGIYGCTYANTTWNVSRFYNIPNSTSTYEHQGTPDFYMQCGYSFNQYPHYLSGTLKLFTVPTQPENAYVGIGIWSSLPYSEYQAGYLTPEDNYNCGWVGWLGKYSLAEGYTPDGEPPVIDTNPFSEPTGQESTGEGTRDNSSDIIDVTGTNTLPDNTNSPLSITGGFLTAYKLDASEMSALGAKLWSSSVWQDIQNSLYKPLENIIACYYTQAPVPAEITTLTTVKIAGYDFDNEVTGSKLNGNWVNLDCGNINIKEYFASCLDYAPYTNISIYLPYVGIVPLDTDYIIDSTVNVRYNIDLLTGDCVAHVSSKKTTHGTIYEGIVGSYNGNVYASIPLTSSNTWASRNLMGVGSLIAGMSPKNPLGGVQNALNTVTTKPSYQKSGALTSNTGMLGYKTPYLIIERPVDYIPKNYYKFVGLNSYVYKKLSDVKGWFRCQNPIINIKSANYEPPAPLESEVDEIKALLETGARIL